MSQNFITVLIVLNTLVLAMDHHPMDDEFALYLEGFNFAFSVCFMVEMTLKVNGDKVLGRMVGLSTYVDSRSSFFVAQAI